jgi:hypothetical protein
MELDELTLTPGQCSRISSIHFCERVNHSIYCTRVQADLSLYVLQRHRVVHLHKTCKRFGEAI